MFQIISDGSCDLSPEQLRAAGLEIVPFYITLDGKHFRKEIIELAVAEFYDYCIRHPDCVPHTSMPSVQDYMLCFEPHLASGRDILCYCITEKFSGSLRSASVARDLLQEKYPEREILVVDSTSVTALQGLLLLELSRYAREGHTLQETWQRGEAIKRSASIYFTIENLHYLAMGGRIGKLTSLAARGLGIRPLIRYGSGELHPLGVSIGRRRSFTKVAEIVKKYITEQSIDPVHYAFALGWGYDREEAEPFFRMIHKLFLDLFGQLPDFVPIQIGATIGVHTGPYPVGIAFIEKA
ncbi:MAG: DegV family protein [Oscillospiraceae bacterium]|nr:DegV family protein [Oscillospiraceae bacterium]